MNDTEYALRLLFKRFLLSLPFFAVALLLFIPLSVRSLLAPFFLVPPAYILAGPLSLLVSRPVGSIFNPKPVSREIHLNFSIPEARIMEGRYEEALDLLQLMIQRDPQRLEVYMRIMNLAVNRMKQPELARDTFHIGINNLKDIRKRRILASEYRMLMALCRDVHGYESDEY